MVTTDAHVKSANDLREMVSAYYDVEDLVSVGAYKPGTQPKSDRAIDRWDAINAFLRQDKGEATHASDTRQALEKLTNG
jgi:flagellum-specific ATP synthase